MEDEQIIGLYFERSERAISETDIKYGRYCTTIAYNILRNNEDTEECKSDTYIKAWNAIPPKKPDNFRAYLGRIARNIALNMYEHMHRKSAISTAPRRFLTSCRSAFPTRITTLSA